MKVQDCLFQAFHPKCIQSFSKKPFAYSFLHPILDDLKEKNETYRRPYEGCCKKVTALCRIVVDIGFALTFTILDGIKTTAYAICSIAMGIFSLPFDLCMRKGIGLRVACRNVYKVSLYTLSCIGKAFKIAFKTPFQRKKMQSFDPVLKQPDRDMTFEERCHGIVESMKKVNEMHKQMEIREKQKVVELRQTNKVLEAKQKELKENAVKNIFVLLEIVKTLKRKKEKRLDRDWIIEYDRVLQKHSQNIQINHEKKDAFNRLTSLGVEDIISRLATLRWVIRSFISIYQQELIQQLKQEKEELLTQNRNRKDVRELSLTL